MDRRRKPILVVEDDPADREMIALAFKRAEVASPVVTVEDGQEALDYLQAQGRFWERHPEDLPAVIVLDLDMPRMDGFEFLRRVKPTPDLAAIPVVGMMALYLNTLRQSLAVQEEVDRLLEIQVQTASILAMVVDVQDGFRGFVLVRNEKFLEPFYTAEGAFDPAINKLKRMVRDDHEQLQRASQIEARVRALLQRKKRLIDAVRLGDLRPALEHIESGEGPNAMCSS